TTLLAVFVKDGLLEWVSIGDSPLYLVRGGKIERLNADHSLAPVLDLMAENGEISAEQAEADPRRSALRDAVMGQPLKLTDFGGPLELQDGDAVLLGSDGMQTLDLDRWADLCSAAAESGPEAILEHAFSEIEALDAPGQDNCTAILMSVHDTAA
ncbi:MAG: SpoIIE family protein phosphatase, partial [Symploca sp. SIO2B6]|nr:SpoIIE family protein phosphatase [Symploca sp. SIO2B6]